MEKIEKKELKEKIATFTKYCGVILVSSMIEFLSANQSFGQEKELVNSKGVSYKTEEAKNKLSSFEKFYPSFKELKTQIVVGDVEESIKNLSDMDQFFFKKRFEGVGAYTLCGSQAKEQLQKKLNMQSDKIYILYNTDKEFAPENKFRIPYHEGSHAKHFALQKEMNPEDSIGYIRYPQLSLSINQYIEELITGGETIEWLEKQLDPEKTILNDEEREYLPKALQEEKSYFLSNYFSFYKERYGVSFDVPAGEWEMTDPIDKGIENMFKKFGILEVLSQQGKK